jgi:hypothetical protein
MQYSKVRSTCWRVLTPNSFLRYFEHYSTEKAYWNLVDARKDVSSIRVPGYPSDFYWDVRIGYDVVVNRYEESLRELRHRPPSIPLG